MIISIISLFYSLLIICTISLPGLVFSSYIQLLPLSINLLIVLTQSLNYYSRKGKWMIFIIPIILLIYCSSISGFQSRYFFSYYIYLFSVPLYYIFIRGINENHNNKNILFKKLLLNSLVLIPIIIFISQIIDYTGIDNGLISELRSRDSFNKIVQINSNSQRGLFGIIPEASYVGINCVFALLSYFSLKRYFKVSAVFAKRLEKLSIISLVTATILSLSLTSFSILIILYLILIWENLRNFFVLLIKKIKLKKNALFLIIAIISFSSLAIIIVNREQLSFRIIYLVKLFFNQGLYFFLQDQSTSIRVFSIVSIFDSLIKYPFGGGFNFTPDLFNEICSSRDYFLNCSSWVDRNHNIITSLIVDSGIFFILPIGFVLRYLLKNKIKLLRGLILLLFITFIIPFSPTSPLLSIVTVSTLLDPEIYMVKNFKYII